ncbi:Protein of unknown function [Gryllus bimaculatus]|nr:Protein of unknown function [Gryllus bimaculatus]
MWLLKTKLKQEEKIYTFLVLLCERNLLKCSYNDCKLHLVTGQHQQLKEFLSDISTDYDDNIYLTNV